MDKKIDLSKSSLLHLIKLDSQFLFNRIKDRKEEFLLILSFKRTRSHFNDVFQSKFHTLSLGDLKSYSDELNTAIYNFYEEMNDLKWYLVHSEDQPNVMKSHVSSLMRSLEKSYKTLNLYIDAENDLKKESA